MGGKLRWKSAFFESADKTNRMVRLFWIGVEEGDTLENAGSKNLVELLSPTSSCPDTGTR
jgi:hypothetical protein